MRRRHFLGSMLAAGAAAQLSYAAPENTGELNEFVLAKLDRTDFSGSMLVARGEEILLDQAYGMADRANSVPARPSTVYRIASITKLFTASLVGMSLEAGRIDLDATIATYLPDYRGPAARKSTLRQLLHHTSGIENFDKGLTSYAQAAREGMPAYQTPLTPRQLMDRFASGPLVTEPGSTFDYNNADYIILGQILEAVEGEPYEVLLERHILKPLGLDHTQMAVHSRIIPELAPTYYRDDETPFGRDLPVYPQNWYAAGGLCSTTRDLHRFSKALYSGELVKDDTLEQMLEPGLDDYGFGQWVDSFELAGRSHRFAHRPGRIMGANTFLLRMLDDELTVLILANTNLVDTDGLGFDIARRLL